MAVNPVGVAGRLLAVVPLTVLGVALTQVLSSESLTLSQK